MLDDMTVSVTNPNLFAAYAETLAQVPEITHQMVDQEVNAAGDDILRTLRSEPGPSVLAGTGVNGQPVLRWKSDRQRKAFYASKGFGRGIPFQRDHSLVKDWKLIVVYSADDITSIVIRNDNPARPFVTGIWQQPYHLDTGWPSEDILLIEAEQKLEDRVETALIRVYYVIDALVEEGML